MVNSVRRRLCLIEWGKFSQIQPDWIYVTTTELEKLIPGATIALGILYLSKPSEKLPTGVLNPQWFQERLPKYCTLVRINFIEFAKRREHSSIAPFATLASADTRSIWISAVSQTLDGESRFELNNPVSTGHFLIFLYLMSYFTVISATASERCGWVRVCL